MESCNFGAENGILCYILSYKLVGLTFPSNFKELWRYRVLKTDFQRCHLKHLLTIKKKKITKTRLPGKPKLENEVRRSKYTYILLQECESVGEVRGTRLQTADRASPIGVISINQQLWFVYFFILAPYSVRYQKKPGLNIVPQFSPHTAGPNTIDITWSVSSCQILVYTRSDGWIHMYPDVSGSCHLTTNNE